MLLDNIVLKFTGFSIRVFNVHFSVLLGCSFSRPFTPAMLMVGFSTKLLNLCIYNISSEWGCFNEYKHTLQFKFVQIFN